MGHIVLHFLVPALVVVLFFRQDWKKAYFLMILAMAIDLDHLLANPVYDPGRCSIGFHPLHRFFPMLCYVALCFVPRVRLMGVGLVIHVLLDALDCQYTNGVWFFEQGRIFI